MKFKVGDRVRIVFDGPLFGKQATVLESINGVWIGDDFVAGQGFDIGYRLNVDGYGGHHPRGRRVTYEAHDLRPLTDPNATKFIEEMNKVKETA